MSTLKEATNSELSGYFPVEAPLKPPTSTGNSSLEPIFNTFLRCPLPPVNATSDTLRQFYINGQVPQFRILTSGISQPYYNGTGGTVIERISTSSSSSSSSGGSGGSPQSVKTASISTPVINPGDSFLTSLITSRSYQLISIGSNTASRIEMYATQFSQSGDISRALDVAPPIGTYQGIICDVALDTNPLLWQFQGIVGANGDSPQNQMTYLTITNIGSVSTSITATLAYLPLEA